MSFSILSAHVICPTLLFHLYKKKALSGQSLTILAKKIASSIGLLYGHDQTRLTDYKG